MATTMEVLSLPVTVEGSDVLRRAVAGYLARYKDLVAFPHRVRPAGVLGWCTERGLEPLARYAGSSPPPCPDGSRSSPASSAPASSTGCCPPRRPSLHPADVELDVWTLGRLTSRTSWSSPATSTPGGDIFEAVPRLQHPHLVTDRPSAAPARSFNAWRTLRGR